MSFLYVASRQRRNADWSEMKAAAVWVFVGVFLSLPQRRFSYRILIKKEQQLEIKDGVVTN